MKAKILGLLAVALLAGPTAGNANVIYDFTGTCSLGCTGTATGVLTLQSVYVPGTSIEGRVISFSFSSSAFNLNVPLEFVTGTLPAVSGFADIHLDYPGDFTVFESFSNGVWYHIFDPNYYADGGHHTWTLRTAVPEPGTLALLGLGLTGLALSRKRKAA